MIITLDHVVEEAQGILTYHFKPEQPVRYTAGQFVELTVKHDRPDDRGIRRWFTLSSSPSQELLSITTKFAAKNGSTYKLALLALKPGAQLFMSDPMGDFVMPKLLQTPLIFVAGGIGITPFHSMLQWLSDTGEERPIRMLVGVHNENEIVFQDTYAAAGQHVTLVIDKPSPAWGGQRGKLTAELILGLKEPTDDTLIYVSGPESMVETLHKDLIEAGVDKRQLVGDYFPNYTRY